MRIALLSALATLGSLLLLLFGLAVWSRRGERRADLPGARSLCRFSGGLALTTDSERRAEQAEGGITLGKGVAVALATWLESSGILTSTPDRDDFGWALRITLGAHAGYARVWHGPDGTEDTWLLMLFAPGSGGPGPVELLPVLDLALRGIPELSILSIARSAWRAGTSCSARGSWDFAVDYHVSALNHSPSVCRSTHFPSKLPHSP